VQGSESAKAHRRARSLRTALFGLAALLGLGSALGWRWQRPWSDPAHPPRGVSWFFTPLETNAWMRLGAHGSGFSVAPVYGPGQAQRSPIEDLAANKSHVFVAFNDGTIARYSEDDGWQQSRLDVPRWPGPMSMAFLGELEGYAVAGTGVVFRTSDGGARWERLDSRETLPQLLAVDANAGALWALAEKEALVSRDHGLTWTHFPLEGVPPGGWMAEHAQNGSGGRAPSPVPRSWLLSDTPREQQQRPASSPQTPVPPANAPNAVKPGAPAVARPSAAQRYADAPEPPPAPAPPSGREERARPPAGAYQVCATPSETWILTPAGAFTVSAEGRLLPAPVGPGLVRCARSRFDVVGLIDAQGGSWRRRAGSEPWQQFGDPRISDMAMLEGAEAQLELVGPAGFVSSRIPIPWRRDLRRIALGPGGAWILDRDDSLWREEADSIRRAIAFRSSVTTAAEPERNALLAATSTGLLLRSGDLGASWTVEAAFDRPVAAIGQTPDRRWAAFQPDPPPWKAWVERRDAPWEEDELTGAVTVVQAPHPDGSSTYSPLNDFPAALADSWFRNFVPPAMVAQPGGAGAVFVTGGAGPSTAWAVGGRCRISLALSADSTPEERAVEGCTATLRDIALAGSSGWAVGDRGTVLRSTDGGHTWERVAFPSQAALTSVLVSSGGDRVTVFGDGDTIRWTEDGGLTWRAPQNRLYPAPWTFFAVALALTLGAGAARTKIPPEVVGSHIEDLLASDAPITDERQDVLGQAEVARTISYFLQNDRTEAPLTLAVTGEWGTGKSSVLNLVRKRLQRSGMPVIGFNAWHHQQDADPLAALYAAIVAGAVPRGPAKAEYRLRLLARRWQRRAWMLGVIALLGSFLLGLYIKAPHYSHDAFQSIAPIVTCFFADCPELELKKEVKQGAGEHAQVEKAHAHTFWGGGLATLVVVAPILASLLRSLRSFGVNPSTLLRAVSGRKGGGGDDRELLTFHAQFAAEFDDVTAALGRRRLVLLIDDLDRCAPDSLLKMLEAMNFLVSSGKCFVVLAMSRAIVLEALATQLPDAGGGTPAERADRYLQKLINVEVALPQLSPHHGRTLITGASARAGAAEEPPEHSLTSRFAAWGLGAAVALTVGVLVFNAGAKLGEVAEGTVGVSEAPEPPPEEALASAPRTPPPPPPASAGLANEERGRPRGDSRVAVAPAAPARRPGATVRLPERWTVEEPPRPTRSAWAVLPWVLLVWAGLLSLAVSSSPRPMTTDSRDFREALERWCEVIQLRQPTPRALKRFLNRLRFWAMRLRAEKEPAQVVSPWQRLFSRGPEARGNPDAMSEAALVALAALHEIRAELVTEPGALSRLLDADPPEVRAALDAERKASGHPTEEDRLKFLQLLGTVKA